MEAAATLVAEIDRAYGEASDGRGPTLIVARTEKGHGVSFLADAAAPWSSDISLGHVQSVVERRNTIPILSNILIEGSKEALHMTATDMDLSIV